VAPPGNQAVNGENKQQPDVLEETGLLDSIKRENFMKKSLYASLALIFLSFFQTGCSSYSFRGLHRTLPPAKIEAHQKYRLNDYTINVPPKISMAWFIPYAGAFATKADLQNALLSKYPNRFTMDSDATPINVNINCFEYNYHGAQSFLNALLYFFSLGVYPANFIYLEDRCEVKVMTSLQSHRGGVQFRTKAWLSVFSPFGLFRTDDQDGYTGTYRHGSGVFVGPHIDAKCFEDAKYTYVNEVVDEVDACVDILESKKQ